MKFSKEEKQAAPLRVAANAKESANNVRKIVCHEAIKKPGARKTDAMSKGKYTIRKKIPPGRQMQCDSLGSSIYNKAHAHHSKQAATYSKTREHPCGGLAPFSGRVRPMLRESFNIRHVGIEEAERVDLRNELCAECVETSRRSAAIWTQNVTAWAERPCRPFHAEACNHQSFAIDDGRGGTDDAKDVLHLVIDMVDLGDAAVIHGRLERSISIDKADDAL